MSDCRGCGTKLDPALIFADLGHMPLVNALLTQQQLDEPEVHYPLRAVVCPKCLLVQLPVVPDPKTLFPSDYPFYSGQSAAWVQHCSTLADQLIRQHRLEPSRHHVMEIGSNDGTMLEPFQAADFDVTGVEPCLEVAQASSEKGIPTWVGFWGFESACVFRDSGYRADLVIATNVLAHVPDPRDFLSGIKAVLSDRGLAVIEVPYIADMMAEDRWDQIYHEHHCYFSLLSLSALAKKSGLHVVDVEHVPVHGGSLRVTLGHEDDGRSAPHVLEFLRAEMANGMEELSLYRGFAARPVAAHEAWWARGPRPGLARYRTGAMCGYGASAKAAVFCNYVGVGPNQLRYIVDTTPVKQGKYQPGTHIPIVGPEYAAYDDDIGVVVNFCWNWHEESEANIQKMAPQAKIIYPDGQLARVTA